MNHHENAKSEEGASADTTENDNGTSINRTILRRIVSDKLQALLRDEYHARHHLNGAETYDSILEEVKNLSAEFKNGDVDSNLSSEQQPKHNPPIAPPHSTVIETSKELNSFIQIIASSILVDTAFVSHNSTRKIDENDGLDNIKKEKEHLVNTIKSQDMFMQLGKAMARFEEQRQLGQQCIVVDDSSSGEDASSLKHGDRNNATPEGNNIQKEKEEDFLQDLIWKCQNCFRHNSNNIVNCKRCSTGKSKTLSITIKSANSFTKSEKDEACKETEKDTTEELEDNKDYCESCGDGGGKLTLNKFFTV